MAMAFVDAEKSSNGGGVTALGIRNSYGFYSIFRKLCHAIVFTKKFDPLSRRFFCVFFDGTPFKIGYMVILRVAVDVIDNRKSARVFYESLGNEPVDKFWLFFTATVGKPNSQMTASMCLRFKNYSAVISKATIYTYNGLTLDTINAAKIANHIPSFVSNNIEPLLLHDKFQIKSTLPCYHIK